MKTTQKEKKDENGTEMEERKLKNKHRKDNKVKEEWEIGRNN